MVGSHHGTHLCRADATVRRSRNDSRFRSRALWFTCTRFLKASIAIAQNFAHLLPSASDGFKHRMASFFRKKYSTGHDGSSAIVDRERKYTLLLRSGNIRE